MEWPTHLPLVGGGGVSIIASLDQNQMKKKIRK